jgi:hypothetical protein
MRTIPITVIDRIQIIIIIIILHYSTVAVAIILLILTLRRNYQEAMMIMFTGDPPTIFITILNRLRRITVPIIYTGYTPRILA